MGAKEKSEELAANIHFNLENIKDKEGILGYILRNSKFASVDLTDPTKIIDYAMLSSESLETSEVISELFQLGTINSIVLEGIDVKVLSLITADQRLSVFMDKKVDHNKISKDLGKNNHKRNGRSNQDNEENNEIEDSL